MTSQQIALIIGGAVLGTALIVILGVVLITSGGGGNSNSEAGVGQLTNPQDAPTAAPWDKPPDVVILDPNAIQPIGGAPPSPTPAPEAAPGVCGPKYTVESGDTFSSIATKCGSTTQAMKDANPGVDPTTIKPGQQVNVPAAAPSPSP
jgi:LysM repeat protein